MKAFPDKQYSLSSPTGEQPSPAAGPRQEAQLFTRNRDFFGRLSLQAEDIDKLSQIPSSPNPGTPSQLQIANSMRIVSPAPGAVLEVQAATAILEFPTGKQVELLVNGQPADAKWWLAQKRTAKLTL